MPILLHKSKYVTHQFEQKTRTLISLWKMATRKMSQHDFSREMQTWASVSESYSPRYIYDDCQEFHYIISPDEQIWMANLLNPIWVRLEVKKYAHILPDEFISNMAVEQLFEEFLNQNLDGQYLIQHFSDETSAKSWLYEEDNAD